MIVAIVAVIAVAIALSVILSARKTIRAAWYEGYRRAIKDSVQLVEEYGDDEVLYAPAGEHLGGVVRATVAHDLGLRIRSLTHRINRPL